MRALFLTLSALACLAVSVGSPPADDSSSGRESWTDRIHSSILLREREATLQTLDPQGVPFGAPRWHLVNRAAGLRVYADEEGVEFRPRSTRRGDWRLRMALAAGRPDRVRGEGRQVRLARGTIDEYLHNRDEGIEHSFLLSDGPEGPFSLRIAVETDGLDGRSDGGRILFSRDARDVMTYGKLAVFDADARRLDAEMSWSDGSIRIDVLEGGRYPILVDPIASTPVWTGESNQAQAEFGWCVAGAGDVNGDGFADILVGSPGYDNGMGNQGRGWLFLGSAAGPSTTADWFFDGESGNAMLGYGVGSAGDVNGDGFDDILLGAPNHKAPGQMSPEGKTVLFYGGPSGPPNSPSWSQLGVAAGSWFGCAVGSAGDVNGDGFDDVLIGARKYFFGYVDEGMAFVYHGSATGPSTNPDWSGKGDQSSAFYGTSVSGAGDVNGDGFDDVLVGASGFSDGETKEGGAFLYYGGAGGVSVSAAWIWECDVADAAVGSSVSIVGDINGDNYADILIGGPHYPAPGNAQGRAWVFHGGNTGPSSVADWYVDGSSGISETGRSVAGAGDINGDGYADLIVGSPTHSSPLTGVGKVTAYYGSDQGVVSGAAWSRTGDAAFDFLGMSVAGAGDVDGDGFDDILVGAYGAESGQDGEGKAMLFLGTAGVIASPIWSLEGNEIDASLGYSVSSAGDVNGDGFGDVLVGAHKFDNGQTDEGQVFLFLGSASGLGLTADWTAEGNQDNAQFGTSVSGAGDVNGDGFDDILIGAPLYDNGETDEGGLFLYFGGPSGPSSTADWQAESDQANAKLGTSVASAGDVNGDGFDDVIAGAEFYDQGETDEGAAFVYHGSASGPSTLPDWIAEGDQAGASFGKSVSTAGDVDGDGFDDVIVGATSYDGTITNEGAAFVYHGSASGLSAAPDWSGFGGQANALYGVSVSEAGDVNGDGFSDIVVGAPGYGTNPAFVGAVFVHYGSAAGLSAAADWTAVGSVMAGFFGYSVSSGGDVNGDGLADLLVGAPNHSLGLQWEGGVFAYYGTATGLDSEPLWTQMGGQSGSSFGWSVSSAGDVNGDGQDDMIVGAPGYDDGESNEGKAFLFLGSTLDFTPPIPGWVNDGLGADIDIIGSHQILANWGGFSDPETGIAAYEWAVGTSPGGNNVHPWTSVGLATSASLSITLQPRTTYFVTVRALNGSGLSSIAISDGVEYQQGYGIVIHDEADSGTCSAVSGEAGPGTLPVLLLLGFLLAIRRNLQTR